MVMTHIEMRRTSMRTRTILTTMTRTMILPGLTVVKTETKTTRRLARLARRARRTRRARRLKTVSLRSCLTEKMKVLTTTKIRSGMINWKEETTLMKSCSTLKKIRMKRKITSFLNRRLSSRLFWKTLTGNLCRWLKN